MNKRAELPVQLKRQGWKSRLLDAVHRQPAVQAGAAPAGRAPKGMHYWTPRRPRRSSTAARASGASTPATAGRRSSRRSQRRRRELDYAPTFQMGHPLAFELAERLAAIAPEGLDHVFFTNSGSEAVDTALKIALAYHRARGEAARIAADRPRARLSRRRLRRHLGRRHRRQPQAVRAAARRRRPPPHTHDLARNAFSRGQPAHGARARRRAGAPRRAARRRRPSPR